MGKLFLSLMVAVSTNALADNWYCGGSSMGKSCAEATAQATTNCTQNCYTASVHCASKGGHPHNGSKCNSTGCSQNGVGNYLTTASGSFSCFSVNSPDSSPNGVPYFETAAGGEYTGSSVAEAQARANQGCSSGITSLANSCAKYPGRFGIIRPCTQVYARELCPQRCGVYGVAVNALAGCYR